MRKTLRFSIARTALPLLFMCLITSLSAQTVYLHNFGTTTISTHPYTVAPGIFDTNLSSSSWSNSTSVWTNLAGASGQAIAIPSASNGSTATLTFNVNGGYALSISQYRFYIRRATTAPITWSMTINGNAVGTGNILTAGATTGFIPTSVTGLTGFVSVVLTFTGGSGSGSIRIDDFRLDGSNCTAPTITLGANPAVCQGATSANLPYSATTGSPDQYKIDYNLAAELAGFVDVSYTALPATPIGLVVPGAAPGAIYNATLKVRKAATPGCESASMPFTVTVSAPPAPVVTPSPSASVCTGTNVTLSTTSFSSYAWSSPPGGSTQSVMHTPVTNTTYTVTVTDGTGCPGTGSVTVSVVSQPTITLGVNPAVCRGTTSANLPYSATTGSPNQYMIDYDAAANSNGFVDVVYTALPGTPIGLVVPGAAPAATYNATIKVRIGAGCESSAVPFTVTVRPLPTATISGAATACSNAGGNTASVPASSSYTWAATNGTITAGGTTNNITYTAGTSGSTMLSVTVTDANGCTATSSKIVTINSLPTAMISATSPVCANTTGNTATASGGTGYIWGITNGTITAGGSTSGLTYTAGASGTTTLSVTVTDANGCTATASQAVTLTPAPSAAITATPSAVCANSTGNTASTPNAGMGATYLWSITGGTITAGAGTNSIIYTAGASGTVNLSVQVTSGSCMVTGSTSVVINPLPSSTITASPTSVCANSMGNTASVPNAGGGATYVWTINNGMITGGAGTSSITYSVTASSPVSLTATVTANGCSTTGTTSITVNLLPTITLGISPIVCRGVTSANLPYPATTNGPDQYSIDYDMAANSAGFLDVTNATLPATPIGLVVPGAAGAGLYNATLTVRNSTTGCVSMSVPFTIQLRVQPTITASSNSPVCVGSMLNLSSTPASGSAPYTPFAWEGPNSYSASVEDPTGFAASALYAGTYTVTVTDNNSCTGTGSTTVVVNPLPTITLGTNPALCRGLTSANLPYSATTGSPNQYSIDYDAAANTAGFVDVTNAALPAAPIVLTVPALAAAATYNATITVRNSTTGCVSSPSVAFTVVVNANPTITATSNSPVCVGSMLTLMSTPAGGSGVYSTFAWQGTNSYTASVEDPAAFATVAASAGAYTVTVTDNNGCLGTGSTTVVLHPLPTIAIGVTPMATACQGATTANLAYFGTTNSPDQYSLDYDAAANTAGFVDVTNAALPASPIVINTAGIASGTYNATLTVRNNTTGCVSSSVAFTVKINALPSAVITANAACSNATGRTASVPVPVALPATYTWMLMNGTITAGGTTNSITYTAGTSGLVTFNVTVTDANGCSATGSAMVNINPPPSTTITAAPTSVCASSTGNTAFVPVAGGAATYTWALTDGTITAGQGSTTITYTASASGTVGMLVTVTDGNGCSAVGSGSVVINPAPSAVITTPAAICANSSGTATVPDAGMGATYSWSVGNGTGTSSTNSINYTAGGSGTVTLNVTVTALGCAVPGTYSVTINPLPNGSLAGGTICSVGGTGMLTFTQDMGVGTGPFSIVYNPGGVTASMVQSGTPFAVTPNPVSTAMYSIVSITDANGCVRNAGFTNGAATITVTPLPTASISYPNSAYCSNAVGTVAVTLTGTNAYTGGTYSAAPAGLNIGGAGTINPSASLPGTYTVTYTIAAAGGCSSVTATTTVTITALPTAAISYTPSTYCTNHDGPAEVTLTGTHAYTGGTYTASSAGLALDASTGLVTLGMSSPGTYTVTYTVPATGGCPMVTATANITINLAPIADIDASPATTICPGEMVTLVASGGGTYLWSNIMSPNDSITDSPVSTTMYTVTVTLNGCTDTESVTITVPSVSTLVLDLVADPNPVECGELTILTVKAVSGFTDITSLQHSVQWDPTKFTFVQAVPVVIGGQMPSIFSDPMAGNVGYSWGSISVDGDDLAGNSPLLNVILKAKASSGSTTASITGTPTPIDASNPSFCSMTVTVPLSPLSIELSNNPPVMLTASNNGPVCEGVNLMVSSDTTNSIGVNPHTFSWEGPNGFTSALEDPAGFAATAAAAGTYTVTVSDANGCTTTASTTAVVNPAPTVTASNNGPLCAGATLNLTADQTGGTGFSWEGPNSFTSLLEDPSIASATTAAAGTYTVTVTGVNACSATASTSVVINESPTFSFTIGGNPVSNLNNGMPDPSESTTVTRCDGDTYAIADLVQAPANIRYTIAVVATGGVLLFDGGPAGSADISGAALSGAQGSHTLTLANPLMGGTVVQTITPYNDVNNDGDYDAGIDCPGDAITITYIGNPIPNAGSISGTFSVCAGSTTTLTSNGAINGTWSSSTPANATVDPMTGVVSGLTAGTSTITYTVTESGCSSSTSVVVTVNPLPDAGDITGTLSVCVGSMTTLTSDGDGGGVWSSSNEMAATVNPSTGEVTGVTAGTTTITYKVTDGNMCMSSTSVVVTVNALPTPMISGTLSFCTGSSTTLTASASASYVWSTMAADMTQSITVNAPGTYTVTVTSNGCTASTSATVTENPLPTAVISGTLFFCTGGSTTLTASGGATYLWDNASANPVRIVNGAGPYSVIVTDVNGCTASTSTMITVNPRPALQANINTTTVTDNNDGSDDTGSFTVCNVANNLSFGPFIDLNGVMGNVKAYQTVAYTNASAPFCNNCAGTLAAFTGPGTVSLIDPTMPGTLVMSFRAWVDTNNDGIVDADECAGDLVIYTVTVSPLPDAGTITGTLSVCVGSTTTLTSNGNGGGTWSSSSPNATVAGGVVSGVTAGPSTITYTVTAGDCTSSVSVVVTVNPAPTAGISGNPTFCTSTTLTATGGVTYLWDDLSTNAVRTISVAGTYTVTVTGANSCTDTESIVVTQITAGVTNLNTMLTYCRIQDAINDPLTLSGHVIQVAPGTYYENVLINKQNLTVCSSGGKGVTTIIGTYAGGNNGTVVVPSGINGVTIGGPGKGFTIIGFDGSASVEAAAVYLVGTHTNITIEGNEIRANGDGGLLSDFNLAVTNVVINANMFTGQTFLGSEPGGCGFGSQFSTYNVPRQLVTISNGSNVTFTNNMVTGTAGAASTQMGCETNGQGNTLVTIDVAGANIRGNLFAGTTARFATSLRARGTATSVCNNTFESDGLLGAATAHIFFGSAAPLGGATPSTLAGVASDNAFPDGGYYLTPDNANSYVIYRDLTQATAAATAIAPGQTPVAAAASVISAGTITGTTTICVGQMTTLVTDGATGGEWSSSDAMIAMVDNTGKVTGLAGGTVTITYTVTASGGCEITATTTVTVNPLPAPSITGSLSFCTGGNTTLTTGAFASYIWSTMETTQSIVVTTAGTYTVTVTDANGCTASTSATVVMNPRPALQAIINATTVKDNNDGLDDTGSFTVCNEVDNITFGTFTDLNLAAGNLKVYQTIVHNNTTAPFCNNCSGGLGVFTGSGTVSLGNPALPGTLVMSFRAWIDTNNDGVVDANECAGDWVVYTITVNPVPDAGTISGAGPVCAGSTVALSSTGASGGMWSSSEELVATVDGDGLVSGVAVGTATITYTVTANNCSSSTSASVTVNALPVVTCPANISVCVNATAFALTGETPSGGTYSGTGVSAGMFDPAVAGVGTHTITYSYTDGNMCTSTCTFSITVSTLPVVTCPANTAVCLNVPAFVISGASPAGGTYSGTGVNMSGDMFDPSVAGVGNYTLIYTYNNGCTNTCSFTIEVKSLPVVTCPTNLTVCADAPAFAFTGETPTGGTFSGTGVSGGMFNPATAGVGVQTITYTVTGENTCTNTCTFTVTVNALPTFAFTAQVGARPAQTGNNNGGPTTVTIDFCAGESFALSGFSASPIGQVGFTASYTASGNVTYNGGNIGVSGSSPITPGGAAAFFAGTYGPYALDDMAASGWITQIFTPYNDVNTNGSYDAGIDCEGAPITLQYNIYANPNVIATPAAQTICAGGTTSIALTSSVANTTFAWVIQSTTGAVTGQSASNGNTIAQLLEGVGTVTYRITPTGPGPNNCPGAYTDVTITVNPRPTAVISGLSTICNGQMAMLSIALTGTGPWSGMLSNGGPAIPFSGAMSPISLSVSTMSTTTYTLTTLSDANCTATASDLTGSATVTVNNLTAGTIGSNQTICSGGDPAALTVITAATGAGTLTYRWESSTTDCNAGFTTIVDSTSATLNPPVGLTVTTYYRRVTISTLNSVSCEAVSNCVTVIVNAVTSGSIADNQIVCPGGDPAAFTEASSASGTNLSYRWESSTTPGCTTGFAPVATGITYDPPTGLTTTTYYRRVAIATQNNNSCEAVSNCLTVTVEDNTPPTITCPANSTIAADASCTNLLGTWLPVATFDACGTVGVVQSPAASTLLDGHNDLEVVTLTANDGNGNMATCSLTVTLKDVTAPAFDCGTLMPITVFTDEPSCNSDTDIPVPVAVDNCEGSISAIGTRSDMIPINSAWPGSSPTTVTWTFTDPAGNVKTCTQTVTVLDNDAPIITCPPNISTQDNDPDTCGAKVDFISLATATDNCGGIPTISYSPASGSFLPVGTSTVIATANDGRGNTVTCTFTVTIQDTQRPTFAFCPSNITVTPNGNSCNYTGTAVLNPTGMDNCAGFTLNNSYNNASSLVGASFLPSSTTTVTWKVTDAAGNTNTMTQSCSYTVTVGPCISITGMICWKNFGADPMAPNVGVGLTTVNLTGASTAVDVTPATGLYTVVASVVPGNYTVTPTKNITITNGLTSLDALRVQQHAIGAMPFTDPFMLIAADVNRNNMVNTTDATLINQVILGNPAALVIFNKSWRFVPKSWSLTIIPWGFPETLTFSPLTGSAINQDFWGIKLGDLVTAYANPANKPSAPPIAVVWTVQDQVLEAGQEVEAEFRVNNFENIGSYQFALHFNTEQLEVVDILPTQALSLTKGDNFGLFNVANGELRTVWSTPQGAYLTGGTRVFRVKFRAIESGSLLSEVLRLDESVMAAEAAKTDLQVVPVELVFTQTSVSKDVVGQSAQLRLMQNRPNPVLDQTTIGFELPQGCEATLRIVDVMGRVIAERTATYSAGYHEERFRLEEVGAQGVLYYELITPYGQLSNKMMLSKD